MSQRSYTYYDCGALQHEEQYFNGKLHGLAKGFYRDGKPDYEDLYVNGQLKKRTIFYKSGNLQCENNYNSKGRLTGIYKAYYDGANSQLHIESQYSNGRLHGPHNVYNQDGHLIQSIMYVNGQQKN